MATTKKIRLKVNGVEYVRSVDVRTLLLDFIREELQLTGTHAGCEHGVCGACTVLLNGKSVRSCLLLAAQIDQEEVLTVEGLATNGQLSELQNSFWNHHALQCGFCTPGFLMTAQELINTGEAINEEALREALAGNLCRCTGYQTIIEAVLEVLSSQSLDADLGSDTIDSTGGGSA